MNRLTALIAFIFLLGFLGILAAEVPRPDLIGVIVLTLCLAGYDFVTSSGRRKD